MSFLPVDEGGVFTSGRQATTRACRFDANRYVVADLREQVARSRAAPRDLALQLVREKLPRALHRTAGAAAAPSCTSAVSSRFVRVTEIRDRMVELNQEITWTPAH